MNERRELTLEDYQKMTEEIYVKDKNFFFARSIIPPHEICNKMECPRGKELVEIYFNRMDNKMDWTRYKELIDECDKECKYTAFQFIKMLIEENDIAQII